MSTSVPGGSGGQGAPGGGGSTPAIRLASGLWGVMKVVPNGNATPDFERVSPVVGSCKEWDFATTAANTNVNGYGTPPTTGSVTPVVTIKDNGDGVSGVIIGGGVTP